MSTKKTKFAPKTKPTLTVLEMAGVLKINRRTLEKWRNEGCPGLDPKRFKPDAALDWAKSHGKRAGDAAAGELRAQKLDEEIRKLRLANDARENTLIRRAWVAERMHRAAGEINAYRLRSETEHAKLFAATNGDIALCRTHVRRIWDEIMRSLQTLGAHFEES